MHGSSNVCRRQDNCKEPPPPPPPRARQVPTPPKHPDQYKLMNSGGIILRFQACLPFVSEIDEWVEAWRRQGEIAVGKNVVEVLVHALSPLPFLITAHTQLSSLSQLTACRTFVPSFAHMHGQSDPTCPSPGMC